MLPWVPGIKEPVQLLHAGHGSVGYPELPAVIHDPHPVRLQGHHFDPALPPGVVMPMLSHVGHHLLINMGIGPHASAEMTLHLWVTPNGHEVHSLSCYPTGALG